MRRLLIVGVSLTAGVVLTGAAAWSAFVRDLTGGLAGWGNPDG